MARRLTENGKELELSMTPMLVFGNGLVGSEVVKANYLSKLADRNSVDVRDRNAVERAIREFPGQAVVNCVAFTNVAEAQKQKVLGNESLAYQVNVLGARNIAEVCARENKFFVQLSTDFVFSGSADDPGPYVETTPVVADKKKQNFYGYTKSKAEEDIEKVGGRFAIIRLAYPSKVGEGWLFNLLKYVDSGYPLYIDQQLSTTFIPELVTAINAVCTRQLTGVFHVTGDLTTPYLFATYALERLGRDTFVRPGELALALNNPEATPKPLFGGLKTDVSQEVLGKKFKTWREQVDLLTSSVKISRAIA